MGSTPALVSWNLTRACNLRCGHCYLDARGPAPGELGTEECLAVLRQMRDAGTQMVILSGGEPLLRGDLLALVSQGASLGLTMVLGTNGCLLDEATGSRLAAGGLRGAGISLDSIHPEAYDAFRGVPAAWKGALQGASSCRGAGIPVVLQATVLPWNCQEIGDLVALASEWGAWGINFYFLVCTGRGDTMTNITREQYWQALVSLSEAQARYPKVVVRTRCAPQAVASSQSSDALGSGCMAGVSYARVTPEGEVTPCPYLPFSVGNLREGNLSALWQNSPVLHALRATTGPAGCQPCYYRHSCRGCRARAFAATGDLAGQDPWCSGPVEQLPRDERPITWTPAADELLVRVPSFLRPMVRRAVEGYARRQGYAEITPEIVAGVRERMRPAGLAQPQGGQANP
ncbi:MAG: radical SAM protein [Chloroflexi bacterium]|nr:radical SAM protein [Chloroflexota bacterium]